MHLRTMLPPLTMRITHTIKTIRNVGALTSSNWAVATWAILSLTSWEICRRSLAKEQAQMKNLMADYRAKVKQQKSAAGSSNSTGANAQAFDEKHVKGPHIGGVLMGQKGKEMLEQQQQITQSTASQAQERLV
jgi:hypothetical protein